MLEKSLRSFRWFLGGIGIVYAFAIYGGFVPMPFKVTDPADPRFNVERFRFEDYPSAQDFSKAIRVILPVGTTLEEADRVLMKIGGAKRGGSQKSRERLGHVVYYYQKWTLYRRFLNFLYSLSPRSHMIKVTIEFDSDGKVYYGSLY